MSRLFHALMVIAIIGGLIGSAPASAEDDPVELTFVAALIPPALNQPQFIWQGPVSGDSPGTIKVVMRRAGISGAIWALECALTINAGNHSSAASLSGIYNTANGTAVMNGAVTDGFGKGRRGHVRAHLVSIPQNLKFTGTFRIGGEDEQGTGVSNASDH